MQVVSKHLQGGYDQMWINVDAGHGGEGRNSALLDVLYKSQFKPKKTLSFFFFFSYACHLP